MPIRLALVSDIPEMQRVRASVRENTLPDYSVLTEDMYRDHLEHVSWVYEQDGRIVGLAIANLEQASIWALFVEPDYEGRGIGRTLHDTMLEWLHSRGATTVTLGTDPNTRASHFYEAAGWTLRGTDASGEAIYEKHLP